jgi:hypothetical protein
MENASTDARRRGPAPPTIRGVVAAGAGTYRRRFGRIVAAAVLIFAPIDLIVTLSASAARSVEHNADVLSVTVWLAGTGVNVAGTTLSLVFFTGVIDRLVALDQLGHEDIPLFSTIRRLPTARLILASILTTAAILLGLILLVVPGYVLMVLLCIVGPVIVIEDLRVLAGLRRSAQLVWPHLLLATVVSLVPAMLDEELTSWLERSGWYESPLLHLGADILSTILIGGLIGVFEVTLAHALIADHRRRHPAAG